MFSGAAQHIAVFHAASGKKVMSSPLNVYGTYSNAH